MVPGKNYMILVILLGKGKSQTEIDETHLIRLTSLSACGEHNQL